MGKPVEKQNLSGPFFWLSVLLVLVTGWAYFQELWGLRPWKRYQEELLALRAQRAREDGRSEQEGRAPSTALHQYWLLELGGAVDRCQSCHANIDTCGYSSRDEVLVAYARDVEGLGLSEEAFLARFCLTRERLEAYRQAAGGVAGAAEASSALARELPVWARTHPHRDELLGARHPPERFGCTVCHDGQGSQTKGVAGNAFAHGHDDPYWERPLLDQVDYTRHRPTRAGPPPVGDEVPGEQGVRAKHLVQASCGRCHGGAPELPFGERWVAGRALARELGCHGCHAIAELGEAEKVGPPLGALSAKMTRAALEGWLANPRAIRPRTRMPSFWPEALDGDPDARVRRDEEVRLIAAYLFSLSPGQPLPPVPVRGRIDQGRRLAWSLGCRGCHAFGPESGLCTQAQVAEGKGRGTTPSPAECEVPAGLSASPERRDVAPNLSRVGARTRPEWLFAFLKAPAAVRPGTTMPSFRLSDAEAADLTAFLGSLRTGEAAGSAAPTAPVAQQSEAPQPEVAAAHPAPTEAELRAGRELVTRYGCAGCHFIPGHEGEAKVGVELDGFGSKSAEHLDFGRARRLASRPGWYDFVDLKLRAPRAFRTERIEARMPQYDLGDDEVEALMVFLKSLREEQLPEAMQPARTPERLAVARGERVLERYRCRGCHAIDGRGGTLAATMAQDTLATMAPPPLQREGARVRADWLVSFLRHPTPALRPWLEARMPTFAFSEPELEALVQGFAAAAKVRAPAMSSVAAPGPSSEREKAEVRALVGALRCHACHPASAEELAAARARGEALAPDLRRASARLRPEWIRAFLERPQSLQEGTRMPAYFSPDEPQAQLYPDYLEGSQARQLDALSNWVISLGEPGQK